MTQSKPFFRTVRAMKQNPRAAEYILDKSYASDPLHYIRAYLLIQSDLLRLFEYIEPSDESEKSFSYRIHALLMRTCIEVEANLKAIMTANTYTPKMTRKHKPTDVTKPIFNMHVYKKVNASHRLSSYEVILPIWNGQNGRFRPFRDWAEKDKQIKWYVAYNNSKHDRQEKFKEANLKSLVNAVAGLLVLISAQFRREDFAAGPTGLITTGDEYHEFESATGSLFRIKYPDNWEDNEIYDFDWQTLKDDDEKFARFNYDAV